jgi:hypothetical protein
LAGWRSVVLFVALASSSRAETLAERYCPSDPHVRAGHPQAIHRWAQPTITPAYCFGYVGGGAAIGGQPRTLDEGSWGMDYCGRWLPHRVWLNWYHGRFSQGGSGRYETDGPHLLKK